MNNISQGKEQNNKNLMNHIEESVCGRFHF